MESNEKYQLDIPGNEIDEIMALCGNSYEELTNHIRIRGNFLEIYIVNLAYF